MYREEDLKLIRDQIRRRTLYTAIVSAVLLAAVVYSFIIRIEPLTVALSLVLGCMLVFVYDLLIRPLRCYAVHVDHALHGRTRQMEGAYLRRDEEVSLVDGVKYIAIHVSETADNSKAAHERLFYFDVQKPFPDLHEGDPVRVVYYDREVVDLTLL